MRAPETLPLSSISLFDAHFAFSEDDGFLIIPTSTMYIVCPCNNCQNHFAKTILLYFSFSCPFGVNLSAQFCLVFSSYISPILSTVITIALKLFNKTSIYKSYIRQTRQQTESLVNVRSSA